MKVFEILDSSEQEELMVKVLEKHGFTGRHCIYRSKIQSGKSIGAISISFENVRHNFMHVYIWFNDEEDKWQAERHLSRGWKYQEFETPNEVIEYLKYLENPSQRKKVAEMLDPADADTLMRKLLTSHGYEVTSVQLRNKPVIRVKGDPQRASTKYARIALSSTKDGNWVGDIIGGQGHKLTRTSIGDEQTMLDFLKAELWEPKKVTENILSKDERMELLTKLLKSSGFYAQNNNFGWVNVYHLGDYSAMVSPHGQSWECEVVENDKSLRGPPNNVKRLKDEAAVVDFLNGLRTKISEEEEQFPSLFFQILKKRLDSGDKVYIRANSSPAPKISKRPVTHGLVKGFGSNFLTYDHKIDRSEHGHIDSNSTFFLAMPPEDHYNIKKIADGQYEIVNAE